MNRTLTVARMQFVNRYTFVWMPLIILVGSFLLSLVVFALIPYDGAKYGGGSQAPIWYFFALGIMALSYTFPFSQAMSLTRREFFFGTMIAALCTSAMLGVVFAVGGLIETATRGWGVNGYFFAYDWVWQAGALTAGLFFGVVAMLLFVLGFWGATVYRRFGAFGLTIALGAVGVLLVGALWLLGRLDAWGPVFGWLASQSPLAITLWLAAVAALSGAGAFLTLRHATAS